MISLGLRIGVVVILGALAASATACATATDDDGSGASGEAIVGGDARGALPATPSLAPIRPITRVLYSGKACDNIAIGAVGPASTCTTYSGSVQSVRVDGVCRELITALTAPDACARFKGGNTTFHAAKGCGSATVAAVGSTTDCGTVGVSPGVQSVMIDGVCSDMSPITTTDACARFKGGSTTFFTDHGCSTLAVAAVGPTTDCTKIGAMSVQSVRIDGVCSDIQTTNVGDACRRFSGG